MTYTCRERTWWERWRSTTKLWWWFKSWKRQRD